MTSLAEPLTTTQSAVGRDLLKMAHLEKDIYFSGFFHNHLSHGLLSLASMNASDKQLEAHCSAQSKMLQARPQPLESVGDVTQENWYSCLDIAGVKASGNFLNFFDEQLLGDSPQDFEKALATYALDPRIVHRLIGGAIHPLIHLGFACELRAKEPETARILLSEALAMQCTTRNQFKAAMESLKPIEQVNEKEPPLEHSNENRVLQVLDVMSCDPDLTNIPPRDNPDKCDYTISQTDAMAKYYNMFPVTNVDIAFEQLFFGALAIVFGSILSTKEEPRLDFFLAHCLTSAVSLRQVLPYIENENVAIELCRFHFVAMLAWHRARGHPIIDIANLMKQPTELDWDECEARLRADPGLEVHSLKVLRALQMGKSEAWAIDALKRGCLPGADENVWLICANLLVKQIRSGYYGGFKWLHGDDAWEYYNT